MDCGLRRCECGQLMQAKPSNHCVTAALDNGICPWTSVDYLSQLTERIRKQERPIAFPDKEVTGRAADGPDAARTKGHSRSTTVAQAFVTSTYVSAGRAKGTITVLPSWSSCGRRVSVLRGAVLPTANGTGLG
jgi:hypothetical protein